MEIPINLPIAEDDARRQGEWRFAASAGGSATGRARQEADGLDLLIEHADYTEGSRWEQDVAGIPAGMLLSLQCKAQTSGPCLRRIGENIFSAGAQANLKALTGEERSAEVVLAASEHIFYPSVAADFTIDLLHKCHVGRPKL